jgi:hypothetical protein
MIRLFRKIRHRLLSEDKYSIYILYASGEIILVVIGILLALQIDNWNDNRKLKALEISTLEEFASTLKQDTTLLGQATIRIEGRIEAGTVVITALENRLPFDPSLAYNLSLAYQSTTNDPVNTTAFNLLVERGSDIVSNSIIRKAINQHYTINYQVLKKAIDGLNNIHRIEAQKIYGHFKYLNDAEGQMILIPDSWESVCSDRFIVNAFYHFRQMAQKQQVRLNNHYTFSADLLQAIQEEISRLE